MLPIVLIIVLFQYAVIRKPFSHVKRLLVGLLYLIIGISFFMEGLDLALFPLGKLMAAELTAPAFLDIPSGEAATWQTYAWVYAFAASVSFAATLAEPSLLAIALKVQNISGGTINAWGLRIAVAFGVAIGTTLGVLRIITGTELSYILFPAYGIIVLQTLYTPKLVIALAYDVGPVTLSTVTVPLLTALGVGLATTIPGRNPLVDGFGLLCLASVFPVIAVLSYAQLAQWLGKKSPK
jgi:hypothetical protein